MTTPKIITRQPDFHAAVEALTRQSWIALDTEFMRVKTYAPILCLLQVSSADHVYCVDPLAIQDMSDFSLLLNNPSIEKTLHSCRQDFEALDTRLTTKPQALFDTQIAAAFCGYGDQVSYAALVESIADVQLAKSHTRADWQKRPLSVDEINYAMEDVQYLYTLRDHLYERLQKLGRLQWFIEECAAQCNPSLWVADPTTAWQRLKGAAALPVSAHETAKSLAVWRDHQAVRHNRPREWILSSKALIAISAIAPDNVKQLHQIAELPPGTVKKYGEDILNICATTVRDPDASPCWTRHQNQLPEEKSKAKAIMKYIKSVAEDCNFSPSLLANRQSVEKLVQGNRELPLLKGWRYELVGKKILDDYCG